eukprot:CAMPEP_0195541416 /NCGR_PEP_ID=MMETSP0794_2-20130614/51076_1 /TAXON_ID=515487 /ORGANISM="Stephanopyxis turris, Strain CCMP 815" /LENGTH=568 /DNA_ID=CAMNT_0040675515 /DNA_START=108 /DNA_END=1811 /DNA_ORIENTATION=-
MTMLPVLLQESSMEDIFAADGDSGSGVLIMIRNILVASASLSAKNPESNHDVLILTKNQNGSTRKQQEDANTSVKGEKGMYDHYFNDNADYNNDACAIDTTYDSSQQEQEQKDTLKSTCVLCTSLLVALLELGNPKRSNEEEDILKSLLPVLQTWSSYTSEEEKNEVDTEMAEMSSHASALILSRDAPSTSSTNSNTTTTSYEDVLQLAKEDLNSDMPPLRARGVVRLRHFARAITEDHQETTEHSPPEQAHNRDSLITTIHTTTNNDSINDDESSNNKKEDVNFYVILGKLLTVTLLALKDEESYVYLAAVQTLSVIGDACPSYIMPRLAMGLARGYINIVTTDKEPSEEQDMPQAVILTQTQRVKIAEALIFAMKRRGNSIGFYAKCLFQELFFGCRDRIRSSSGNKGMGGHDDDDEKKTQNPAAIDNTHNDDILIQQQTHAYFKGREAARHEQHLSFNNDSKKDDDEYEDDVMILEEKQRRLLTGGPMFQIEENHAIRAACYSCIANLVSVLPTNLVEGVVVCKIVRLCVDSLRLDATRPVSNILSISISSSSGVLVDCGRWSVW